MNDLKIQVKYTTTNINGVLTDNCTYLDLYEYDIPKITISIEDIVSTNLKTPYTNTFRVPNSKTNSSFFRDVFDINGIDFDVTKVVDCYIIVDDNIFTFGELRLNKVYEYELENKVDYEVVFIGRLRNLVSVLSTSKVNELDWSGWTFSLDFDTIVDSWSAYPETDNGGIIMGDGVVGDVIFPLVEFGYEYNEDGSQVANDPLKWINLDPQGFFNYYTFTESETPLPLDKFRPMIRAKAVFDKIMDEAGFTYDSNFLNGNEFKNLYISVWGNKAVASLIPNAYNAQFQKLDAQIIEKTGGDTIYTPVAFYDTNSYYYYPISKFPEGSAANDYNGEFSTIPATSPVIYTSNNIQLLGRTDGYRAQESGIYDVVASVRTIIQLESFTSYNPNNNFFNQEPIEVQLIKNSSGIITILDSFIIEWDELQSPAIPSFLDLSLGVKCELTKQLSWTGQLNNLDIVNIRYKFPDSNPTSSGGNNLYYTSGVDDKIKNIFCARAYMNVQGTEGGGLFNLGLLFDDELLKIDFIKDITKKFRLIFDEDKTQPNKFIIEPFKDYVGTDVESIFDWTDKLDLSKPQQIEPIFYTQKKEINFIDEVGTDFFSKRYETQNNNNYANLDVYYDNQLLIDKREIKTDYLFNTPTIQLGNYVNSNPQLGKTFFLPVMADIDIEGAYTIEDPANRFTHINPIELNTHYAFYNGRVDTAGVTWYLERPDADPPLIGYSKSPMISARNEYPLTGNTLWLTWSKKYFNYSNLADIVNNFELGETVYDRYWKDYIEYLYDKDSRIYTAYFKLNAFDLFTFNFSKIIQVKSNFYYVNKIENMPLTGDNIVKVELIKLNGFTPPYQIAPPVVNEVWNTTDQVWNTTDNTWDD